MSLTPGTTSASYREAISSFDPDTDWLATPERGRDRVKLRTIKNASATIGFSIVAKDIAANRVQLSIGFTCNPTRTLAHLLWRYRDVEDAAAVLASLGEIAFFSATSDVPLAFDNQTNWLFDLDLAHRILGNDVFSTFLPIYVRQLRALAMRLVSPELLIRPAEEDGGADVHRSDQFEIRLGWNEATAPQCETYFERHHGSAIAVVRSAAQNVLTKLDDATVRHHLYETSFARRMDLFSLRCRLPRDRELSIYAKAPARLRFEISRKTAGRYHVAAQPDASGRLLSILTSERADLIASCQWRVVGELLTEHGAPVITDLTSLIAIVAGVCSGHGESFRVTMSKLLIDGGMTLTRTNGPLIASLVSDGVLQRVTLRRRDGPLPRRYSLVPRFLQAYEAVLDAFSESDPGTMSL